MASTCEICNKRPEFGNTVSHSHLKVRRRRNPNIQTVRIVRNGNKVKMNVCTSCIKADKVAKIQ